MRVLTGNILALDLATHCGWAVNPPHEEPDFGTEVLPSTGDAVGPFIAAFDAWLKRTIEDQKPALIIYEQPSIFAKTTPQTVIKLNGLATHTEFVCHQRSITVRSANPSQLKKFATGNGRADKPMMVAAARRRGWKVTDDNQADAAWVRAWAIFCFAAPEYRRQFDLGPLGAVAL